MHAHIKAALVVASSVLLVGCGAATAAPDPVTVTDSIADQEQVTQQVTQEPEVALVKADVTALEEVEVDCFDVLAEPDDGTDQWLDCWTWYIETSETDQEQEDADHLIEHGTIPSPEPAPEPTTEPTPETTEPIIEEDSPEWDCRVMGNETCGVEVEGDWYVITFKDGAPVHVTERN